MLGPEGAQDLLETYLAAAFPAVLDDLAGRLNIADRNAGKYPLLPNPSILPPVEVQKLTEADYPAVIVTVWDVVAVERVDPSVLADIDDPNDLPADPQDGPRYQVTYTCRVFTFARGDDFADTQRARFRYALALREAILARPSLASPSAMVDEASWRESYSELEKTTARTIGASYAEFRLTVVEELLTVEPVPVVDVLEVYPVTMPLAGVVEE